MHPDTQAFLVLTAYPDPPDGDAKERGMQGISYRSSHHYHCWWKAYPGHSTAALQELTGMHWLQAQVPMRYVQGLPWQACR